MPYLLSGDEICILLGFLATHNTLPQELQSLLFRLMAACLDDCSNFSPSPQVTDNVSCVSFETTRTLNFDCFSQIQLA